MKDVRIFFICSQKGFASLCLEICVPLGLCLMFRFMIDTKLQEVIFYSKQRKSARVMINGSLTSVLRCNREWWGLWQTERGMPCSKGTAAIQIRYMLLGEM